MDFLDAYDLIHYIINQRQVEFVEQRWIHGYQTMPLSEFKERVGFRDNYKVEKVNKKAIDEVLLDLQRMFG